MYSGKSIKEFYIDEDYIQFANEEYQSSNSFREQLGEKMLISTKIHSHPRCSLKPEDSLIGAGVIKVIFDEEDISRKTLCALLNSTLIEYICKKYLMNMADLTMNLNTSVLPDLPIKIPEEQGPYTILTDYLLFLNKQGEVRENKKDLITLFKEVIDLLVYELYFADNLDTKLIEEVGGKLKSISGVPEENEKLEIIARVAKEIRKSGFKEIKEKLKKNDFVKKVENSDVI